MEIGTLLVDKRDALIDHMMAMRNKQLATSLEDTQQFIRGFVDLVERAALGDQEPLENYLESVVPAIKSSGMPLWIVMEGMVRVAMSYTAVLAPEHHQWVIDFVGAYTTRLAQTWEAA